MSSKPSHPHNLTNTQSGIQAARIPTSRLSRLSKMGQLVGGVAGSMLAQGSKQLLQGQRPTAKELLLSVQNAKRLAEHLSQMRGAAMKVGQLLSMDAGDLIPEELTLVLAKLRSEAKSMPLNQLVGELEASWGKDWQAQFQRFSFYPIAAASIGQVHETHTQDGRHLALKIQYPGIRTSIDSDVDNLASLLRLSRLIPKSVNLDPILQEAKLQLHAEANYLYEADCLKLYQQHLGQDPHFTLPKVHDDLSSETILAMDFVEGVAIESRVHASQVERDLIMQQLFKLLFKEMFVFQLVQTDPNFANYQFNPKTQRIVLLDFGATRSYSDSISQGYLKLMRAAQHGDLKGVEAAAEQIGFFSQTILPSQKAAVLDLFMLACEPLRHAGTFDFVQTDLAQRIKDQGMALSLEQDYWHTPPADALFFHRKLGGLYLLAAKLKARVNLQALFLEVTEPLAD
ncbi:ABC1 kinase family protein [Thiosulfativibrio zosterae]|uniref:Ubiquinol-cytochrome c reductase n=1 Tax=Thiosulfativibrio zosterae TaxID=2675053 RepID=A0A6F8PR57_9GAMM|nr:AarF/ABC1/UbiB kinase family protein [Thiosulfativibrio zosterae]BBP44566.1 ubiquinol-cytochrome c reductase [Thiosulfativibrio zosterae]